MEIHWIAVLLTLWWFPNDTATISHSYHQQQGSEWTIDKAKLVYHYSSTEQYSPSSRQAKNIFPIQQPAQNNRDDNTQNRYQQQHQPFRNYNNNMQQQQQAQHHPSSAYGAPFLRQQQPPQQYPSMTNQFSQHWKNFSPPVPPPPPPPQQQQQQQQQHQQPQQSYPPPKLPQNHMKITRPSLPDLLPPIIENAQRNPEKPSYQFKPSAPIAPTIDPRIVSRPNKVPLVVPTQSPYYPTENSMSDSGEKIIPQFSPPVPTAQSLVSFPPQGSSYEQINSNGNKPAPVYLPQKELSEENIDSQSLSNSYESKEHEPISHSGEESEDTYTKSYTATTMQKVNSDPNREIRFLIHKAGDEEIIKNAISEESKYSNEQVSFIKGPDIQLQRKQKIYLPPKKKTVVYILLKEPQIETDVEVMEQAEDPKPEVYIIYQKGNEMLTRHYSADSNTLKQVKNLVYPPSSEELSKALLASASSTRKETVVKAPGILVTGNSQSANAATPMCLNNKPVSISVSPTTRPIRTSSTSPTTTSSNSYAKNSLVKTITKS